ncbi:transcriptional regulator [Saccharothrix longispora]|uniref:Helix-turn-helix protein n=1 Tax=Saccharothrix longispora TaxID=33920 RepID=A0ABU1Q510_9PSEU|nr:transcriptional regulator [Saccharothrix longispora]MDR6597983.1 hypothetical protein [Saccharothrix longispora]
MSSAELWPSIVGEIFDRAPRQRSRYTVSLRTDVFRKATALAGYYSDYSLAPAMGVHRSTICRVRSGSIQPGKAFISGALTVLAPMEFEDLFEVSERD